MIKEIYLAGGCFWGVEAYFDKLKGVIECSVGYADGNIKNPSYIDLINKIATHSEAVYIKYNSNVISLEKLIKYYFNIIDPYSYNKQGNDKGIQYRTAIYTNNYLDLYEVINITKKLFLNDFKRIAVEFKILTNYYLAEDYHQKYLIKNPNGYCHVNLFDIKEGDLK